MHDVKNLANFELLTRAKVISAQERQLLAEFLEYLIEIDRRKLYAETSSSLYTYLTGELSYSESAAGRRVTVTRLCARVPEVLAAIRSGKLHLSSACCLASILTSENAQRIVADAAGKSMRQVEELLVHYAPKPAVNDGIRRQNSTGVSPLFADGHLARNEPPVTTPPAKKRDELKPATPEVYNIRFAAKRGFVEKLERAQELLSHSIPDGSYEEILEKALDVLLAKKDPALKPEVRGATPAAARENKARSQSRYIPKAIERAVVKRDAGRCTHVDPATGKRCSERKFLHIDHVIPVAMGGSSSDPANLRQLCAAHNQLAARRIFGASWMERKVLERRDVSTTHA